MSENSNGTSSTESLVPVTAHVPESTRKRVRVLAAQMDVTRTKLAELAFNRGLDILEQEQKELEEAETEATEGPTT